MIARRQVGSSAALRRDARGIGLGPIPLTQGLLMLTRFVGGMDGRGHARCSARLTGHLLIFRLMTGALALRRRGSSWCARISSVTSACCSACLLGGKARAGTGAAARGPTTSHEGQAIGIDTSGQGSVVHHAPDGVVREQQPIHLLQHTVRALRAQHRAWATLMRLRFIQGSGFSGWVAIRRRGCCCTSCAGRWFALVGGRWVASWRSMRPSSVGARGLGRPVGVWGTRAWW